MSALFLWLNLGPVGISHCELLSSHFDREHFLDDTTHDLRNLTMLNEPCYDAVMAKLTLSLLKAKKSHPLFQRMAECK